jgi:hypothetical protein
VIRKRWGRMMTNVQELKKHEMGPGSGGVGEGGMVSVNTLNVTPSLTKGGGGFG